MALPTRYNWFLGRTVTAQNLDNLTGFIQTAIDRLLAKRGMYGLLGPSHSISAGAGFTIGLTSNDGSELVRGYDKLGNFVSVDAEPYTSGDLSDQFDIPTAGNEKWITFVLRYAEVESDPQYEEMTFDLVNFQIDESFEIVVLEGAEDTPGNATKPSLAAENGLYLGDCLLTDASADFTINPPVIDSSRHRKDPLHEASLRGADGVENQLAFLTDIPALALGEEMGGFSVHKNGVVQAIPHNVWTKVEWPTEKFDLLGEFDIVNDQYFPTKAGVYKLDATVTMNNLINGATTQYLIKISKNSGAEEWVGNNEVLSTGFTDPARTVSALVEADGVNDYFEVYVKHTDGGPRNVTAGEASSFFQGYRMPANTSPSTPGEIGYAQGFWDYRGKVDFQTGVITLFGDEAIRTALTAPDSLYEGDTFQDPPYVIWSIVHTGRHAGASMDQARIVIGAEGSSAVSNAGPATTGDTGTLWDAVRRMIQEGGIISSPTSDINLGYGVIASSSGVGYFTGRIAFVAWGVKN